MKVWLDSVGERRSHGSRLINRSAPVGNVNVQMIFDANLAATFGDFGDSVGHETFDGGLCQKRGHRVLKNKSASASLEYECAHQMSFQSTHKPKINCALSVITVTISFLWYEAPVRG